MRLTSIDPKEVHDFLAALSDQQSVIMLQGPKGLLIEVIEDKSEPPGAVASQSVRRADVLAVLKLMVALLSGRPAKLASDKKGTWKMFIGTAGPQ